MFNPALYIIEFSTDEVQMIAHALHLYGVAYPKDVRVRRALKTLREQTSYVYENPVKHKVFKSGIILPEGAVQFPTVYHTRV